jgi:diaminopimelate decarboxylase
MLRVNLPFEPTGAVLAMGGKPSQFGLTVADVPSALAALAQSRALRLHGIHTHLASGLAAPVALTLAADILDWAMSLPVHVPELTLGGGMAVDYGQPEQLFDWTLFGSGLDELSKLAPDTILRIEPGRAISAYCGYYVTVVNDVKHNFAILNGGTHQFRTPAAKSHSHPFQVVPVAEWPYPWPRPELTNGHVTLAGQLCTPKDILAANVPVRRISAGDLVVFIMAGAYGWNISHQEFLMHRKPSFHYLKT